MSELQHQSKLKVKRVELGVSLMAISMYCSLLWRWASPHHEKLSWDFSGACRLPVLFWQFRGLDVEDLCSGRWPLAARNPQLACKLTKRPSLSITNPINIKHPSDGSEIRIIMKSPPFMNTRAPVALPKP